MVNDTWTFNSSLIFNNFNFMLETKMNISAKNISGEICLSIKKQPLGLLYIELDNYVFYTSTSSSISHSDSEKAWTILITGSVTCVVLANRASNSSA